MLNSAENRVVLKSSPGPKNNIPDNLLTKDHHPTEPSKVAFSLHSHLFLQKGFYLLSVNLPCQKYLSSTLVLVFFLTHCRLTTRILLIKDLVTLHGKAFALSNLTPDHLLHRSYKAVSINEPIPWFGIYNGFLGIHLLIALSAFSLSFSRLLESYFI